MKPSFLLGILGGIFSFSMGVLVVLPMAISNYGAVDTGLTILIVLAFLAGILGIVGGVVGNRKGGAILIISGVLALIATPFFGILPFILLIVGGVLAFRERKFPESELPKIAYYQLIGIIGIIFGVLFLVLGMLSTLYQQTWYWGYPPVVDYPYARYSVSLAVAGTVSLVVGIAGAWRVHQEETSVEPPPHSNPPQPSST
jgi:hypothetical protein